MYTKEEIEEMNERLERLGSSRLYRYEMGKMEPYNEAKTREEAEEIKKELIKKSNFYPIFAFNSLVPPKRLNNGIKYGLILNSYNRAKTIKEARQIKKELLEDEKITNDEIKKYGKNPLIKAMNEKRQKTIFNKFKKC